MLLIRAFSAVADVRIVHDPLSVDTYNATYVPHPLYYEFVGKSPSERRYLPAQRVRFGILGSVRPYKRIDKVLQHWPPAHPLLIAGWAPPEYARRLRAIIDERGLDRCVETRFQFLGREEFDAALDSIDVLVLPHAPDTALVSGAIFEAVGRVPTIIVRRSPFAEFLAQCVPGVFLFERSEEIATGVERAQCFLAQGSRAASPEVRRLFGVSAVLHALGMALRQRS